MATERRCPPKSGKGVFRCRQRRAPMSDHRRKTRRGITKGIVSRTAHRRQAASRRCWLDLGRRCLAFLLGRDLGLLGRPCRLRAPRPQILAGLLVDLPHAELYLSTVVKAQHFDLNAVAELDDIGYLADTMG